MEINKNTQQKGYVLVMVVCLFSLIIVAASVAVSAGLTGAQTLSVLDSSQQTLYGAYSGLERGILSLAEDSSYSGSSIIVDNVNIEISVSQTGPQSYIINSKASYAGNIREARVTLIKSGSKWLTEEWGEVY